MDLGQQRCNIANVLESRLSYTNLSVCGIEIDN